MPAEVLYKGPTPPAGQRWCFACAYTWKAAANERFALKIEHAMKMPDGAETVWIDATDDKEMPHLATAIGLGIFAPMQNLGPIELCWSHLTAIRLQSTGGLHLPVPGMPGPGGMNGMGGLRG